MNNKARSRFLNSTLLRSDVQKIHFLTRPAPARQDAPFLGQGRKLNSGVPQGATVVGRAERSR